MKALLNPWVLLAALLVLGGTNAFSYWRGGVNKQHAMESAAAREQRVADKVYNAALSATAQEIAKIEVKHVTINRKLEKEVRTERVYAECQHTDAGFRLLNDALTNRAANEPAGGGGVPAVDPARGPDFRGHVPEAR